MKKSVLFAYSAVAAISVSAVLFIAKYRDSSFGKELVRGTPPDPYTLTLDASNVSPDGDGKFSVTTADGNTINFESNGLTVSAGVLNLTQDGWIKNPYEVAGDHNKISGLLSIANDRTDEETTVKVRVDYTWGDSLASDSPYYQRRDYVVPRATTYAFLDEKPNYVNIKAVADVSLNSITLRYDCSAGAEGGDNLQIGTAQMLERFKTVVNLGNSFEGQTVELSADIDMDEMSTAPIGNSSNPFKGVFEGNNHTISNLTLSGVTLIAPFGNVVGGVVKNVTFENISATSSDQRAAGVVARAVDAYIENAHVTGTSTITGTTQNGGIVAVVVAGTEKTTIKSCTNSASVTGTTGGGNGGILGYVHGGDVLVYDSTNNGNVTSSTSGKTVGGIVGSVPADNFSLEINLCEVGETASVQCNGVEATSARATNGILIGSANTTLVTVIASGKVTNLIGDLDGYSDFVSACASSPYYQYKVAKLTADIDFGGTGPMVTTFHGLFDGDGHTLDNYTKSGSSQIALFGNVLNGGVKNLVVEHISTSASTQRAAAIAGRSEKASYKNIEVKSGTISGTKQNGGIIGAVVIAKTMIVDCINRASVSATNDSTSSVGGIVGIITSTNACIEMDGCKNYGPVSSAGGSLGGIVGYLSETTSPNLLTIKNTINYGTVSSTGTGTGKAGIVGYFGKLSSATRIEITNCENRGDVSGTGEYTGGVFGGWATKPSETSYIATIIISETDNYGAISGSGNGLGGIFGASNNVQDYLIVKLLNCDNHGDISGVAYVGGIEGLIRNTSTTNESIVDGCNNYGNITSTGTGCGGIAGTARINVVNCGCYYDATLKAASTTKKASAASEVGAPGFIALNYESGCPTHSGNRLINSDGSDYAA
ncbi:MAG: hypothetical protein IJQ67_04215 [Bacilli bacterium]|nr:hypothetical protein [Bacilli bacterium]